MEEPDSIPIGPRILLDLAATRIRSGRRTTTRRKISERATEGPVSPRVLPPLPAPLLDLREGLPNAPSSLAHLERNLRRGSREREREFAEVAKDINGGHGPSGTPLL